MMSDKRDINDPDFFEDENLDAIGEPVGGFLAEEESDGDDGEVVVDESDADESDDDSSDSESDDGGGEDEDEGVDDDAGGDSDEDAAELHLNWDNLEDAQHAYNELRGYSNREVQDLQRQLAEAQQQLAQAQASHDEEFVFEDFDSFDAQENRALAEQNPGEAFKQAMESSEFDAAQHVVQSIFADSNSFAQQASQAAAQGAPEHQVQELRTLSQQASNLGQQLQGELTTGRNRFEIEKSQEPLVAQQRAMNIQQAEAAMMQQTDGKWAQRRDEVIQVLTEHPGLIQAHDPASLHRAYDSAYRIAVSRSPQARQAPDFQAAADKAVADALARARAAKKEAAGAAQGGGGDRRGSEAAGESADEVFRREVREGMAAENMGARGFMDMAMGGE